MTSEDKTKTINDEKDRVILILNTIFNEYLNINKGEVNVVVLKW